MMLVLFVKQLTPLVATVLMEKLDLLMEAIFLKAELRYASIKLGEQSVIQHSVKMKPM